MELVNCDRIPREVIVTPDGPANAQRSFGLIPKMYTVFSDATAYIVSVETIAVGVVHGRPASGTTRRGERSRWQKRISEPRATVIAFD